jgi:Cu+-exporting ATPase
VSDTIESFREIAGRGIMGEINNLRIQIGSSALVGVIPVVEQEGSTVYVSIDGDVKGYFVIRTSVRRDMKYMLDRLAKKCVALLSGDNDSDKHLMSTLFTPSVELLFNQTPRDKLAFVRELQKKGKHVMMVGDGLNDSGALKQSDVGIAITDDTGVFTPACDGILAGEEVNMLDTFLALSKQSVVILKTAFGISFLYNAIALSFAVTGNLTPIVAAVLMPLSSISVVAFSSAAVNYSVNKKIKK